MAQSLKKSEDKVEFFIKKTNESNCQIIQSTKNIWGTTSMMIK